MEKKQNDGIISALVACVVALFYWWYAIVYNTQFALSLNKLGNIKCYVVMVLVYLAVFASTYFVLQLIPYKTKISKIASFIVFCVGIIVVIRLIYPVVDTGVVYPKGIMSIFGILLAVMTGFSLYNEKFSGGVWIIGLMAICALLWAVSIAAFNTYSIVNTYTDYNIHHTSAYMDTIYNVLRGMPFEGGLTEQYGHYGLFFLPFALTGINTKGMGIVMGLMGAATFILCMLSFCTVVKSNLIRALVMISATTANIYQINEGIYWQVFPHRLFFPALLIFMVTLYSQKGLTKRRYIIGSIVAMLAVLWNFESGIVSAAGWCAFVFLDHLQKNEATLSKIVKLVLVLIGDLIFSVIGSLLITDIYNLICGGKLLSLKKFLGMLLDKSYMDSLVGPVEWGNAMYLHKIMAFLICLAIALLHNKLIGIEKDYVKTNTMAVTAIMGLGLITYYMNRTQATEGIINLYAAMCFGFLVSLAAEHIRDIKKAEKYSMTGILWTVLGFYAVIALLICFNTGIDWYGRVEGKFNNGAYNYKEFKDFTKQLKDSIPKDTWAKGEGTTAMYMELGWDKKTRDFCYFTDEDRQTLQQQDTLLVQNNFYGEIPAEFTLVQEFTFHDAVYGYYQRVQ